MNLAEEVRTGERLEEMTRVALQRYSWQRRIRKATAVINETIRGVAKVLEAAEWFIKKQDYENLSLHHWVLMYDYFNRMRFKPYSKRMNYDASNGRLTLASIKRILVEEKVPLNVRQANGETPRQLRMGTLAELSRSSENRKVVYERKYMRIMSLRWYVINAPWKQCTNHWGAAENAKTLRNLCQKGYLKKYFD